ncbi:MAG: hypothetical protein RKP46_08250 [Candidatus Accumulibacter sp.]|nr:hypothetical protein [Accumulibacter sp.]MDS4014334.1 hypothetical protein [Accumulibacter sp.]
MTIAGFANRLPMSGSSPTTKVSAIILKTAVTSVQTGRTAGNVWLFVG